MSYCIQCIFTSCIGSDGDAVCMSLYDDVDNTEKRNSAFYIQ